MTQYSKFPLSGGGGGGGGLTLALSNIGFHNISHIDPTDNGDGSVTMPTIVASVYKDANKDEIVEATMAGGVITLVDGVTNYIVSDHNTDTFVALQDRSLIDYVRYMPFAEVFRSGTNLHIQASPVLCFTFNESLYERKFETERYARAYGLDAISVNGSLEITISGGRIWSVLEPYDIPASSVASKEFFCYHVGGVWTVSTNLNPKINNTQFDNGTDLVTAAAGKWLVNWIFRGIEDEDHVYIVLGNQEYASSVLAQSAHLISALPEIITSHAMLVGRVIVEQGATSNYVIESAFQTVFAPATSVSDHEALSGLLGGSTGQHYHLTSAQHTVATQAASGSVSGYLSSSDWTAFSGKNKIRVSLMPALAELTGAASEPLLSAVAGTNVKWSMLDYNDTTANSAQWLISGAQTLNYAGGSITIKIRWKAASATTNSVVWSVAMLGRVAGEALDTALTSARNFSSSSAPGTLGQLAEATLSFTPAAGELTAGDTLLIAIARVPSDVGDTMVGGAQLIEAELIEA